MTAILLDPSQERAVELVCKAPIGIVTGGPGTGKTTCLRAALGRLERDRGQDYAIALASPTGKAARRMTEATGCEAQTVHRLLEWSRHDYDTEPGRAVYRPHFLRNARNPLDEDLVVVDEASMLDTELAAALLDAIDVTRTRLILVGDVDQLPSVGPGRVFADLIASDRVPVARLTTLHRAAAESWVCTQAPAVLGGRVPDLRMRADFEWIEREHRDDAVEAVIDVAQRFAPEDGAQVLVPQNVGPAGAELLNRKLQPLLNPAATGAGWKVGGQDAQQTLRVGDRVIQTKNDYDIGIFNGETGVVRAIVAGDGDGDAARLDVDFGDGRVIAYSRDAAKSLRLSYALTIHKSQGSEWPWVIVLAHSTHTRMLDRSLLYTAITRAKKGVVLVGDRLGLERAVRNTGATSRNTTLAARVRGEELDA